MVVATLKLEENMRMAIAKGGFPGGAGGKEPACQCWRLKRCGFKKKKKEMWVQSLGREDLLEEEMATHFSILAWRIPWTEEPGGLQSTVVAQSQI